MPSSTTSLKPASLTSSANASISPSCASMRSRDREPAEPVRDLRSARRAPQRRVAFAQPLSHALLARELERGAHLSGQRTREAGLDGEGWLAHCHDRSGRGAVIGCRRGGRRAAWPRHGGVAPRGAPATERERAHDRPRPIPAARPQPRARARARDRGRRARGGSAGGPRRQGGRGPGGGGRHALHAAVGADGRRGGGRRGREGRGADALQRRAHRRRLAARGRHRGGPARGHHARRQRHAERARGDRALAARHDVRPGPVRVHGEDGGRARDRRPARPRPPAGRDGAPRGRAQGLAGGRRDGGGARPPAPRRRASRRSGRRGHASA